MASVATMRTLAPAPSVIVSGVDGRRALKPASSTTALKTDRPLRPLATSASTSRLAIAPARPLLPAGPANGELSSHDPVTHGRPPLSTKVSYSSSSVSTASPSPQPSGCTSESTVQPKKEWVLPARAKPGRKPSDVEPPTKRKAQNRASQRAFRERRQSYLSSLEAKVAEYEEKGASASQDIQRAARRLKEENDSLKTLNAQLVARVKQLEEANERRAEGEQRRTALPILEEAGLAPALTETAINRDCGFCTEQSFCVCSGEAVLDFNAETDTLLREKSVKTVVESEQASFLQKKSPSSSCRPKLWQTQSSHGQAKSTEVSSSESRSCAPTAEGLKAAPFVAVGLSMRLRARNSSHVPRRKVWTISSSNQQSSPPSPSAPTRQQNNAFVCPTASHWQRRWTPTPLHHRYSYQGPHQSTLSTVQTAHVTGLTTPRPLLLSPPSLSAYSLSSPTSLHQHHPHYKTSRMTSSSRDEQHALLPPPRKASIWPLDMLAEVVTRTSDDEKSVSKAESASEEEEPSTAPKRKPESSTLSALKRRRIGHAAADGGASITATMSNSPAPPPQACACPLSKIM